MPDWQLVDSIHAVEPATWDRLWQPPAGGLASPFTRHAFLAALEDSGCTSRDSGWQPQHLLLRNGEQLLAAMPLYLKYHSYGEYVFDWAWADAYHRHGLHYYPKLLAAIPFTPASGARLALAEGEDRQQRLHQATAFLSAHCRQQGLSGWHCLFPPAQDEPLWPAEALTRHGCQFHWYNRDYRNFDHFLEQFNARKRKAVRRERRQVAEAGVELQRLVGTQIGADDWDNFYRFYHTTYLKRSGGTGYLNRDFFERLASGLGEQILMVKASRDGRTIASALCFFDHERLYGRYWGSLEDISGLHFEACYYQGIEFAIEHKLQIFDPGAQGEHKIQRGFEPTITHSHHWLADERFQAAVADFLQQERRGVDAYRRECETFLPFRVAN